MEYTKHTWETGELITASKMNNIEEGIEQCASNFSGMIVDDGTGIIITLVGSDSDE